MDFFGYARGLVTSKEIAGARDGERERERHVGRRVVGFVGIYFILLRIDF